MLSFAGLNRTSYEAEFQQTAQLANRYAEARGYLGGLKHDIAPVITLDVHTGS